MNAMLGQSSTSGRSTVRPPTAGPSAAGPSRVGPASAGRPPGRRARSQGDHGQLALLEADEPMWRLDAHTREVGRKGVAVAREILRRSSGDAEPGEQGTSQAA